MGRNYLISHNHKICFVHVAKTGTTTIAKMIVNEEYPTEELHDMDIWRYCKTIPIFSNDWIEGYDIYCFVRNPFSRVYASFIHFLRSYTHRRGMRGDTTFNPFVKNRLKDIDDRHFIPMRHFINRSPAHTKILRFENFAESMREIWGSDICHENKQPKIDYHQAYNDESVKIVSELYKWDIENLGYSF